MLDESMGRIFSFQIKQRADGITDQYNRIWMTRFCIIFAIVCGIYYGTDRVTCFNEYEEGPNISDICWLQGFFIYKELMNRTEKSSHYGIPRDLTMDGMLNGSLCRQIIMRTHMREIGCQPLERRYYRQYQYMPFLLISFAILFYIPHVLFMITNNDIISLRKSLNKGHIQADEILATYFNRAVTSNNRMTCRVLMNVFIRFLYLIVNLIVFLLSDRMLNGEFSSYGTNVGNWEPLNTWNGQNGRPMNVLLPTMGLCEVTYSEMRRVSVRTNNMLILCEISPHGLYQYIFLMVWYLLVFGMTFSIIGIFSKLFGHRLDFAVFGDAKSHSMAMKKLTKRESEYLECLRSENISLYSSVLEKMCQPRCGNKEMVPLVDPPVYSGM